MVGTVVVLLGMVGLFLIAVLPLWFLGALSRARRRKHGPVQDRDPRSGRPEAAGNTDRMGRADEPAPAGRSEDCPDIARPRPARGEPIEELSADLRRIRGRICTSDHLSATHQIALRKAYDQALMDTCELLETDHELEQHTVGIERDLERLRVEADLEGRGIVLHRPSTGRMT